MSPEYAGQQRPEDEQSSFNALAFVVKQALAAVNVATLVEVVAVNISSPVAAVGTVDVKPLIDQTSGTGEPIEHVTIYELPYFRLQGGKNAIIVDPQIGDVGFMVCCDRDTSAVRADRTHATPASKRRFNFADGFYIGAWSGVTPERYIQVSDSGIKIVGDVEVTGSFKTTGSIDTDAAVHSTGKITSDSNIESDGTIKAATDVIIAETLLLKTHVHSGVQTGSSLSGGPL